MGPRLGLKRRDETQMFLQNLPWDGISQGARLGTSLFDVGRWVKKALVVFFFGWLVFLLQNFSES